MGFEFFCPANNGFTASNKPKVLSTNGFGVNALPRIVLETAIFRRILTKANFLPGAEKNPGQAGIG